MRKQNQIFSFVIYIFIKDANRKSDKEISRMTKEHRTPYYEQKKKIKTRR